MKKKIKFSYFDILENIIYLIVNRRYFISIQFTTHTQFHMKCMSVLCTIQYETLMAVMRNASIVRPLQVCVHFESLHFIESQRKLYCKQT